ncbi:MAG: extracellular solute-binding protein [Eubacteriales bacterium]
MKTLKRIVCLALVLALSLSLLACGGEKKVTLNVLNWGDYIDPDLLRQFEDETGIKVKYTTMTSNEEMLVKLASADNIYDVCFPSDYVIEKLVEEDLLYAIDKDNIPNMSNIDSRFLDLSFDPGNTYSVPYMWGTVGILYNTTMVTDPVDSWNILWNENTPARFSCMTACATPSASRSKSSVTISTRVTRRMCRPHRRHSSPRNRSSALT